MMKLFCRTHLAGFLALAGMVAAGRGETVDFVREVKPVLEKACIQCHGPEKQKGGLRLDTKEALLKGSEEGPAVVLGKPEESELYRRAALPAKDEDVMPPKGKAEHLTAAELEMLKRWIAEGARWPAGVVAVAVKPEGFDAGPVPGAAELAARAELAKYGVRVRPIAAGMNWSAVSFRKIGREVPAAAFAQIGQLTGLVELDLGGTNITDEGLAHVAGLSHLAVLNLSGTAITDAGVAQLARLGKLRSLNVFGTRVTDAGVAKLTGLKQLKHVYAAETKVSAAGVEALRRQVPGLRVEMGSQFVELTKKEFFGPEAPVGFGKAAKAVGSPAVQ